MSTDAKSAEVTGRRRLFLVGASIALFTAMAALPTSAAAQRFLEVSRERLSIHGDFDDSLLLQSASLSVNVPALETAGGLGITIGSWSGPLMVGFSHVRTNPRATSVLGDTVVAHRAWGLDLALAPLVGGDLRLGPMVKVGTAFTTIGMPGQATSGSDRGDARFSSVNLRVGVGGIVRIRRLLHVSVDVSRSYLKFGGATGLGESVSTRNGVSGTGNVLSIALGAYFPR